jgi:ABC-2 type transport system ATP-binding protein
MEEVERLADHLVVMDHGRVIADASPQALYARLPATAALHLEFVQELKPEILQQLSARPGVTGLTINGLNLDIALQDTNAAMPLLAWLETQTCPPTHFATAKARLEDVFLTLTGRSLRD